MKAITTKYIGPSNVKGSRISASDGDGNRAIVSYDCALNSDENHAKAAETLLKKMSWDGEMVGGWTKDGMAWVFVKGAPRIGSKL